MRVQITNPVFHRAPAKRYPLAVKSEGIYIYDQDGKRYLDGSSGALVCNIGHGVSEVVEAMTQQAKTLTFAHGSMFTTYPQKEFAEAIVSMAPGDLSRVYFVSGGSEATETALKMARQYHLERGNVRKHKIIARWMSFHGNTLGALSMTGHVARRRMYDPYLLNFSHIPPAYCYRCPYDLTYPDCGLKCAYTLEDAILMDGPENVSAFITEPLVGSAAAAIYPPPEYFPIVREICDKYDVLFITDEVMCGCGRTGKYFAIDHWGVVPDLVATAKGLGSGYVPLGAVIAGSRIFEAFRTGSGRFEHGHTYQGNPVACATGATVLKFMRDKGLIKKAADSGAYLLQKLEELHRRHPLVGDVRGKGLMLGMEFVQDKETREPFPPKQKIGYLVGSAAFEEGLIVYPGAGSVDGERGDHILIGPPLTIEPKEINSLVEILDVALTKVEKKVLS